MQHSDAICQHIHSVFLLRRIFCNLHFAMSIAYLIRANKLNLFYTAHNPLTNDILEIYNS